jgi:peptide/nickel transport system ATP-binding protein
VSTDSELVLRGRALSWTRPDRAGAGGVVLAGADVEVRRGELVALSGPSGSGKTVLGSLLLRLRALGGGGRVHWDEHDVSHEPPWRLQPLRASFQGMLQYTAAVLPPFFTVGEALMETARQVRRQRDRAAESVASIAQRLGIEGLLDRAPRFLSGGEQRKASIARLVLARPVFAFVDEPDAGLDPLSQQETMALLREAVDRDGVGMLLVTHNAGLSARWADRRLSLQGGVLVDAA